MTALTSAWCLQPTEPNLSLLPSLLSIQLTYFKGRFRDVAQAFAPCVAHFNLTNADCSPLMIYRPCISNAMRAKIRKDYGK